MRVTAEDSKSYTIDDGSGKTFKVAKLAISKETAARIKKAAAKGKVPGHYDGELVEAPPMVDVVERETGNPGRMSLKAYEAQKDLFDLAPQSDSIEAMWAATGGRSPEPPVLAPEAPVGSPLAVAAVPSSPPAAPQRSWLGGQLGGPVSSPDDAQAVAAFAGTLAPADPNSMTLDQLADPANSAWNADVDGIRSEIAERRASPSQSAPAARRGSSSSSPTPPPAAPIAPDPDVTGGIEKMREAAETRGRADVELARATSALEAEKADRIGRLMAERDLEMLERQKEAARLFEDYRTYKIDPNRVWTQSSTIGKVSAAIGMILSGIGSALTKQPNAALAIIERTMENDLRAQQLELGTKENALSHYMKQTGDIRTAYELTRADFLDAAAARLAAAGAKAGEGRAQADALKISGELQAKGAELRANSIKAKYDEQSAALEAQYAPLREKLQTDLLRAQADHQRALAYRARHPQPRQLTPEQALEMRKLQRELSAEEIIARMVTGKAASTEEFSRLPEKMQERGVQTAEGWRMAKTPEAAKKVDGAYAAAEPLKELVRRLQRMNDEYGSEVANRASVAEMESLTRLAQLAIKDAAELGTLDSGSIEFMEGLVTNPSDWIKLNSSTKARLDTLDRWVDSRLRATENAYLVRDKKAIPPVSTGEEEKAVEAAKGGGPIAVEPGPSPLVKVKKKATGQVGSMPRDRYEARKDEFELVQ